MKKINFDVKYRSQIESGEYKVETRDGKPVRIICWDRKSEDGSSIVALVNDGICELGFSFENTGRCWISDKDELDLFIITPEFNDSEDEEIRKGLVNFILYKAGHLLDEETEHKFIAYLEKQKELFESGRGLYYYDGEKTIYCSYPATEEFAMSQQEKQKDSEFTHHEFNESLQEAVTHQMEDDSDVDDFVRRGIDDIALKYAELGARWQKEQKPIEWSDNFEENVRNLLHDKLTWHSKDGSISSTVFIDDKTLKDIISGIWFYVGKEALKYPNKELNVTEWSERDEEIWQDILELCNKFDYDDACRLLKSSMKNKGNSSKSNTNSPWKPSEEQMKALEHFIRSWGESGTMSPQNTILCAAESLYNDLQKL